MRRINLIFCLLLAFTITAKGEFRENIHISGYFQANPVYIRAELPPPLEDASWMEYRAQNRLNFRWRASEQLNIHAQMRTRLFAGDLVREFPGYADAIDTDDGIVNLSWLITEQPSWFLHYIPDRLYAQWNRDGWDIRLGRQRINWGINMMTNPNDIFNIYSFYDFDYPERPGTDALRVQRHLGYGSRIEVAVSPAEELEKSVAAALYAFNTANVDIQLIGGYYREKFVSGGGWATDIRGAGFKGETMFYADFNSGGGIDKTNLIAALSLDYMFTNRLFLITEFLFNQAGGREDFFLMAETLTPDNPSFSRYQASVHLSYPVHQLVDASFASIYYPDESAVFLSPSINWSVIENLDLTLLAQFFAGSRDSAFSNAGNIITATLKYNF